MGTARASVARPAARPTDWSMRHERPTAGTTDPGFARDEPAGPADREILRRVEKPSRYLGTETNSVTAEKRDLDQVEVCIALAFPDLYDIGLGNLGLHILYAVLNQMPWCWAEGAYAPGPTWSRCPGVRPPFALESKDSLDAMDGIGFTLQSELNYTNILNIIDLSGMALRTEHRRQDDR